MLKFHVRTDLITVDTRARMLAEFVRCAEVAASAAADLELAKSTGYFGARARSTARG